MTNGHMITPEKTAASRFSRGPRIRRGSLGIGLVQAFPLFLSCICFPMTGAVVASGDDSSAMENRLLSFPPDFSQTDFQELLRPAHPRLFASQQRWQELQEAVRDTPALAHAVTALEEAAARIGSAPPQERVMIGQRLLSASREILRRTLVLGTLYRITGQERYFVRARAELLNAAAYSDWNPSHFLDTAEMTLALAFGYDWLYHELGNEDRATLRQAILEKGLQAGRGAHSWKQRDNNWNQVCFAGMVSGALAIGEHEPDLAVEFLRETFANIHWPLDAGRPHGAYPEGPIYWNYGTSFQVILLSVLESALGKTWGLENYPGFQESAVYINLMIGPSGSFFNYADGRARVPAMPALHWFARQAGDPALDRRERERLLSDPAKLAESAARDRLFALSLVWFSPALQSEDSAPLPLHWRADGPNPVAVHRSSWDENGLFVGIKGGSPSVNHGHMDIGSFVLDWRRLRWAADLGMQDYESLESRGLSIWDRSQEGDRWRVFRLNNLSHNTLVIDGQPQLVGGFAPVRAFSADAEAPFTTIDMTDLYAGSLTSAVRGIRLLKGESVLLHDDLEGLARGQRVRWGMVTPAVVEVDGNRAVLRQQGETLYAQILSPEEATFEIVQTDPPPSDFDAPNPGTRMLAAFVDGDGATRHIRVVLSGKKLSESQSREILAHPSPAEDVRS